jgi:hypothetical protein
MTVGGSNHKSDPRVTSVLSPRTFTITSCEIVRDLLVWAEWTCLGYSHSRELVSAQNNRLGVIFSGVTSVWESLKFYIQDSWTQIPICYWIRIVIRLQSRDLQDWPLSQHQWDKIANKVGLRSRRGECFPIRTLLPYSNSLKIRLRLKQTRT